MKKGQFLMSVVGLAVSVAILYGTVYVIGLGWKKSQSK